MTGRVNIVTALPAEAKPLIGHFELHPFQTDPYKIYTNKRSIRLIVSGVGKKSVAAAVTHLAELCDSNGSDAWLNVGIAGHRSLPLGRLVAGHKISDEETGRSWYPPPVLNFPCETTTLLTVGKETYNYPDEALVEMEASEFYASASRLSSHELIHCLKVVSDNSDKKRLDSKSVTKMVTAHLEAVESVIDSLLQLSVEMNKRNAPPRHLDQFRQRWKFTVTQSHQLEKLLRRWELIFPHTSPLEVTGTGTKNSRAVLQTLRHRLTDAMVEAAQL